MAAVPRLPPLKADEVATEQRPLFDRLTALGIKAFGKPKESPFIWCRSDGALVGPFPAMLAHPAVGQGFLEAQAAIAGIPGLPADAREVAILVVGARFQAAFELYAHKVVAQTQGGLTQEQAESIARGEKPSGLNEKCDVAYDVSAHLSNQAGPLPQGLWDRGLKVLGKDALMAVVHYVGFYAYTCVILNAVDAPVPQPGE